MKKLCFVCVLLFTLEGFSQGQNLELISDSLSVLYKQYKKTRNINVPTKAYILAEKTKSNAFIKKTYIRFGIRSFFLQDIPNLSLSEQKLFHFFQRTKDSFALAKHYHYKALFFKIKVASDSCFYYYNKSLELSAELKDSLEVARRYLSMSNLQQRERDYLGSENSVINGLRYAEPLNEIKFTSYLYVNLGIALKYTQRFKEARKYYLKYLETQQKSKKKNFDIQYAFFYNLTAKSYEAEFNYEKAMSFYKKALLIDSLAIKDPNKYRLSLEGFSYNNFKLGNKDIALKGYLKVLELRRKLIDKSSLVFSHSLLGEFYASTNQKSKAIFHTKKALALSRKFNNSERILENLFLLSKLIKGEKGRKYLEEHYHLNDSLFKRERAMKIQFSNIRYETEKKEKENSKLKVENEQKQLRIEKEQQQKTIGWLVAGGSFLFIAFGASVVSSRRKKLIFESKLQQVEAREKERQQIAKSLHDEVAGDIRILHKKLEQKKFLEESKELDRVKNNVRNLSHQLSSISFDEVSFKNQIINLVSDFFDANFTIKIKEINEVSWKKINSSIKRTLFLSIRESLQNIDKYADARNVILSFSCTKKIITLTIKDDGVGFDTNSLKTGIGLKNMKERVEEINGHFSVESAPEKGTTITIEIPNNGK